MKLAYGETGERNPLAFRTGSGLSGEAIQVERQFRELQEYFRRSLTMGRHYMNAREAIIQAIEECSVDNWDGYGARRIDGLSCANAERFAEMLPASVPIPEVGVDVDGEVTFDWYAGPRRLFSVAIGGDGRMAYAGLFGVNKTHGTEYLGDALPDTLWGYIRRVYSGGTCLGTA